MRGPGHGIQLLVPERFFPNLRIITPLLDLKAPRSRTFLFNRPRVNSIEWSSCSLMVDIGLLISHVVSLVNLKLVIDKIYP